MTRPDEPVELSAPEVINGVRSKERVRDQGEVMTPLPTVMEMIGLIPDKEWKKHYFPILEPSCGNGNFVVGAIAKKIQMGLSAANACATTFAVDICLDNVKETRQRVLELLSGKEFHVIDGFSLKFNKRSKPQLKLCNYILHYNIFRVEDTLGPDVLKSIEIMPFYNRYGKMRGPFLPATERKLFNDSVDAGTTDYEQNICLHIPITHKE